jgi:hypothetical protein
LGDPRVRNLIGSSGMQVPLPSRCQAIDDTADTVEAKSNAIITSSHFEKVDRGPGYTMRVPVQSVEPAAVGARALPTEEEP